MAKIEQSGRKAIKMTHKLDSLPIRPEPRHMNVALISPCVFIFVWEGCKKNGKWN